MQTSIRILSLYSNLVVIVKVLYVVLNATYIAFIVASFVQLLRTLSNT